MLRARLDHFLRHPTVDMAVVLLILLSVALILLEAVFPGGRCMGLNLALAGDLLTLVFIVELSLRLVVARSARSFVREYWVDMLAVMPALRGFRMLRVLRILRLFRVGKILNRRVRRFSTIVAEGVSEYAYIGLLLVVIVLSGALAILALEGTTNRDFATFDRAFWWSVYSLMAGEPINGTPVTTAGRVVSVLVMFGGVTVFALLTGVVSAFMVHRLRLTMEGKAMDLEDLSNHIIICGWNRAGRLIVEEFQSDPTQRDLPIVIIAEREREPALDRSIVRPELIYFVSADYTQVSVLRRCNVERASLAILLADKSKERSDQDRDARTVLAAMMIEKLNRHIFTCVELLNRDNETHLKMAGVEDVIVGDEYAGTIIAAASRNRGGIVPMVNEIFSSKFGNQLYKIPIPATLAGTTVGDLHCRLKERYNAILVSVERPRDGHSQTMVNPEPSTELQADDSLVVIARHPVTIDA